MQQTDRDDPSGDAPERRCIVTGAVRRRAALIRFVVGAGRRRWCPIWTARLPGRGLWVTRRARHRGAALAKSALRARRRRRRSAAAPDLADRVEALLARRCLDHIGLARRAGPCGRRVREGARRGWTHGRVGAPARGARRRGRRPRARSLALRRRHARWSTCSTAAELGPRLRPRPCGACWRSRAGRLAQRICRGSGAARRVSRRGRGAGMTERSAG